MRLLFLVLFSMNAFGHGGGEAEIEIGPNKGVTEVTPDKSFRLSPEATQNFQIKGLPVTDAKITLPKEAIVHTLKDLQVFRIRNGYLKAINFKTLTKTERTWAIQSAELQSKDEVAIGGVGFLRIIASQLGEIESEEDEHSRHGEGEHHD